MPAGVIDNCAFFGALNFSKLKRFLGSLPELLNSSSKLGKDKV